MDLDEMLGDGEAKSGAAGFARARGIDAIKALENPRLVRLGNSDACVGNRENNVGVARLGIQRDAPARQRVLRGVIEQVLQDFGETAAIAGDVR